MNDYQGAELVKALGYFWKFAFEAGLLGIVIAVITHLWMANRRLEAIKQALERISPPPTMEDAEQGELDKEAFKAFVKDRKAGEALDNLAKH